MSKSPAFQFYPADWLSDLNIQLMTPLQRGVYITLLCHDWLNDGIPASSIEQISGLGKDWNADSNSILRERFMAHPCHSHKLTNGRLLVERLKQAKFSSERSESGKRGALSRWQSNNSQDGSAIKEPIAKNGSSSSSSSSNNITKVILIRPTDVSEKVWADYLKHRSDRKSKLTETALEGIRREANKLGWTLEQAITESIESNWIGFKADWIIKRNNENKSTRNTGHNQSTQSANYGQAVDRMQSRK